MLMIIVPLQTLLLNVVIALVVGKFYLPFIIITT